jgi:hypothetical protein
MIGKRAAIFLMIGVFNLLGSGCSTVPPPSVTITSPTPTIMTLSPTPSTPTTAQLATWIHSNRQTETMPEPVYEVGWDSVTLHFSANRDAAYTLYAFYDFYNSTKSETISNGPLKAGQEVSLELAAAGGLRAFRLVAEAAGHQVTSTASVFCLWVD